VSARAFRKQKDRLVDALDRARGSPVSGNARADTSAEGLLWIAG